MRNPILSRSLFAEIFKKDLNEAAIVLRNNGFVVCKKIISDEELKSLVSHCMVDDPSTIESRKHSISEDNIGSNIASKIDKLRILMRNQPAGDHFDVHFRLKELVDSVSYTSNLLKKDKEQLPWWRFMRYQDGDNFSEHIDNFGEIQGILFLSEPGVDYDGGLEASYCWENEWICPESLTKIEPGDLMFLDGTRMKHRVNVSCNKTQIGRLTLFVPAFPHYG